MYRNGECLAFLDKSFIQSVSKISNKRKLFWLQKDVTDFDNQLL